MKKSLTTKLVITSLTLSIVLMLNPAPLAFAGHTGPTSEHEGTVPLNIPACNADVNDPDDVQAFLIDTRDGIANNPVGGITTFSFTFVPDPDGVGPLLAKLQFDETWTSEDPSYIIICGLAANTPVLTEKIIRHNVADDPVLGVVQFKNFDNELLDPCCDALDDSDDQAAAPNNNGDLFVPIGFSQSNNLDGLSFDMEGVTVAQRNSPTWSGINPDEFGTIDFLNFDTGTLLQGQADNFMTFGLIEKNGGPENPFILVETPNILRVCPPDKPIGIPPNCMEEPIGGVFEGVDTTALLVTGAQMNAAWLIPLLVGMIAIGIVVARKLRS